MGDKISLGLSFDDVLLVPQQSAILPSDADITTRVTAEIALNIPIVASAMDTVTEAELAIALAREGGIGVIHRNCPIAEQAAFVARVKRSEHTVIQKPFTVDEAMTLGELHEVMALRGVSGFPVVSADGKLAGMVTSRDVWGMEDPAVQRQGYHDAAGATGDGAQEHQPRGRQASALQESDRETPSGG